jgi:hypothetical protein
MATFPKFKKAYIVYENHYCAPALCKLDNTNIYIMGDEKQNILYVFPEKVPENIKALKDNLLATLLKKGTLAPYYATEHVNDFVRAWINDVKKQ